MTSRRTKHALIASWVMIVASKVVPEIRLFHISLSLFTALSLATHGGFTSQLTATVKLFKHLIRLPQCIDSAGSHGICTSIINSYIRK